MENSEKGVEDTGKNVAIKDLIPSPPFWGIRVVKGMKIDDIFFYLNKNALFRRQWGFKKGRLTDREYKRLIEREVEPTLIRMKTLVQKENILEPKVVYGHFPCQSSGEDIIVFDHPENKSILTTFTFPRQSSGKYRCISDFFMPVESGVMDTVVFQLVTVGNRATEKAQEFFRGNHYQDYLFLHGLSVEMAEALAEYWHKRIRGELGIDDEDTNDVRKLFTHHYRGTRYSFGYPPCPNLEDQTKLFELLKPEQIGVSLTEKYQLVPEQSTSAMIVHHPEAKYFSI